MPDISKPTRVAIAIHMYPFADNILLSYKGTVRGDVLLHTRREVAHYNQLRCVAPLPHHPSPLQSGRIQKPLTGNGPEIEPGRHSVQRHRYWGPKYRGQSPGDGETRN